MPKANRLQSKPFWLIYFLGFLWAFSLALPLYVQSSFLEILVGVERVGLVVTISTIVTLLLMMLYPRLLSKLHNYRVALITSFAYFIGVALIVIDGIWFSLIGYVLIVATLSLFTINIDIFLERISDDRLTGRIRTLRLTFGNIAILLAPIIMGFILGDTEKYQLIYLIGGIIFVPAVILLLYRRKDLDDRTTVYHNRSFKTLTKVFESHPNIPRILVTEFSLRFFYAVMVLYVPIYLHHYFGFSWQTMGVMFTIMLLPFVLLQIPAGQLADRYLGEKEMIITGLIIMMIFVLAIVFIDSTSAVVWTAVLFMTRVGAAFLEAMNETHFFKNVDSKDMDLIDLFRDLRPLGWLAASLGSFVLLAVFTHIQYVFVMLVCVLLIALWPAGMLKDSK